MPKKKHLALIFAQVIFFSQGVVPSKAQSEVYPQTDSQIQETISGSKVTQRISLSRDRDLSPYWLEYDLIGLGASWIQGQTDTLEISYTVAGVIGGDDYTLDSYGIISLDTNLDGIDDYAIFMDDDTAYGNIFTVVSRIQKLPISVDSFVGCGARTRTIGFDTAVVSVPIKDCIQVRDTIGIRVGLGFGYGVGIFDSSGTRYFSTPYRDVGINYPGSSVEIQSKAFTLAGTPSHSLTLLVSDSRNQPIPSAEVYLDVATGASIRQNLFKTDSKGRVATTLDIHRSAGEKVEVFARFGGQRFALSIVVRDVKLEVWGDQSFRDRVSCLSNDINPVIANELGISGMRWVITRSLNGKQVGDIYDWPLGLPDNATFRAEEDVFGMRYSVLLDGEIVHGIWLKGQRAGEKVQCFVSPIFSEGIGAPRFFAATAEKSVSESSGKSVHDLVMKRTISISGFSPKQVKPDSKQLLQASSAMAGVYKPSTLSCIAYYPSNAPNSTVNLAKSRSRSLCTELDRRANISFTSTAKQSASKALHGQVSLTIKGVGQN